VTFFCISDTLVPTTYLVDTTLSNSSDSDQTVQAVRLLFRYLSSARDRDILRMRGDGMLTSKEAKNNANNHSLQACQSGTWKSSSASIWTNIKTFTLYPKNTQVLGRFKLCINTYRIDGREMAETEVVPIDMPDSNGEMTWQAKNYTQYSSYFMKITCLK
ncbi:hypothetical protein ACM2MT_24325, partial [Escherichia coli]